MATDYFQDFEALGSGQALPTPADTPYQTPMITSSRRSSRHGTSSPAPPSSPPPLLPSRQPQSTEIPNDESTSVLDPRNFTPNLHASLVSEILSLRRELDSKHKVIEDLESTLHTVKNENNALNQQILESAKETRTVKRQLQQVEQDTLAALEDLTKERDGARDLNADLRTRLEASQRKVRNLEEEANQSHAMWERDRDDWDIEKRSMERRVHMTETRLRIVLDELALQQQVQEQGADSEGEDYTRDSGLGNESDTTSIRSMSRKGSFSHNGRHARTLSNSSHRSLGRVYRLSVLSGTGPEGYSKTNGVSLADELRFDEEEEHFLHDLRVEEDGFPEHERRARKALDSRQPAYQDDKAKRVLSLMGDSKGATTIAESDQSGCNAREPLTAPKAVSPAVSCDYVDSGVQFSPPSSPVLPAKVEEDVEARWPSSHHLVSHQPKEGAVTRDSQSPGLAEMALPEPKLSSSTVSAASQTLDGPLSPPATPTVGESEPHSNQLYKKSLEYVSASTQTEQPEGVAPTPMSLPTRVRAPAPAPIPIPSITIHPPMSAPSSPREAILPPGTMNASSQTDSNTFLPMRSISMQTEEIRIDRRPVKLPPHLLSPPMSTQQPTQQLERSHTSSMSTNTFTQREITTAQKRTGSPTTMQEIPSSPPDMPNTIDVEDRYPGNNDNGPLAGQGEGIRRPFRTSSLFAGFDGMSDDEGEDFDDTPLSDATPLKMSVFSSTARTLKHSGPLAKPCTPVLEDKEGESPAHGAAGWTSSRQPAIPPVQPFPAYREPMNQLSRITKPSRNGSIIRQHSIRRPGIFQGGTAAYLRQHSRSPSLGSVGSSNISNPLSNPPFPVPVRSSSRRLFPLSKSEGSQSPTPRSAGMFGTRKGSPTKQHTGKDGLRKVRSAAVVTRSPRQRSRSPPLPSTGPLPWLPPLPKDTVASSHFIYTNQRPGHSSQPSGNGSVIGSNTVDPSDQQNSFVDAIAATMVGEWMWKYVRRRKSFGVQESPQELGTKAGDDGSVHMTGNGIRHKRWVWLSPYERAVMWSSKQPTSESALLGKTGRKLTIQSVLDVKDDTPLPKNAGRSTVFNRSILILTPARALKFTAVSKERHYLWLTALSFLAHSNQGAAELTSLPPVPPERLDEVQRSQGGSLRRAPTRDSVHLTKNKPGISQQRTQSIVRGPSPLQEGYDQSQFKEFVTEGAEPPTVPRFSLHGRKRSLTGPRLPPPSVTTRSLSYGAVPSSTYSSASSDHNGGLASVRSSLYGYNSVITNSSRRTSEASTPAPYNFFEAVGTVRMSAFVEPRLGEPAADLRLRTSRRRGNTQWSGSDTRRSGVIYPDDFDLSNDPFKGF